MEKIKKLETNFKNFIERASEVKEYEYKLGLNNNMFTENEVLMLKTYFSALKNSYLEYEQVKPPISQLPHRLQVNIMSGAFLEAILQFFLKCYSRNYQETKDRSVEAKIENCDLNGAISKIKHFLKENGANRNFRDSFIKSFNREISANRIITKEGLQDLIIFYKKHIFTEEDVKICEELNKIKEYRNMVHLSNSNKIEQPENNIEKIILILIDLVETLFERLPEVSYEEDLYR